MLWGKDLLSAAIPNTRGARQCPRSRSNDPSRASAVAFVCVLSSVVGCAWGWLCLDCLEESRRIRPMPQHAWRTALPRSRSYDSPRVSCLQFCGLWLVVAGLWVVGCGLCVAGRWLS